MNPQAMPITELEAIFTAVQEFEATIQNLQIVPPAKRQRTPTIGRHREQFAAVALEAGRQFEGLLPRNLDMQEVAAIRHERLQLQALHQKVQHLSALLAGHLHALSHADYQNCTHIYRMLRASTQVAGQNLEPTLAALGKAYSQHRTTSDSKEKVSEEKPVPLEMEAANATPTPSVASSPPQSAETEVVHAIDDWQTSHAAIASPDDAAVIIPGLAGAVGVPGGHPSAQPSLFPVRDRSINAPVGRPNGGPMALRPNV